jgi:hypothetical protein
VAAACGKEAILPDQSKIRIRFRLPDPCSLQWSMSPGSDGVSGTGLRDSPRQHGCWYRSHLKSRHTEQQECEKGTQARANVKYA